MNNFLIYLLFVLSFSNLLVAQSEFNVRLYDENKIYSEVEIENLFPVERELIQSEILARYGYVFED